MSLNATKNSQNMISSRSSREQPNRRIVTSERSAFSILTQVFKSLTGFVDRPARKPYPYSRSFAPKTIYQYEKLMAGVEDPKHVTSVAEFFDEPVTTSHYGTEYGFFVPENDDLIGQRRLDINKVRTAGVSLNEKKNSFTVIRRRKTEAYADETDGSESDEGLQLFNNSKRHAFGFNLLSKVFQFGNSQTKSALQRRNRRPYFTYWCTFIQIVVYIVSLITYGIAPYGMQTTTYTSEVMTSRMNYEQVQYTVKDNVYIGPTQDKLIHLGAKYSPCMRNDQNILNLIKLDRSNENTTACCIRNDGYGCVQTLSADCAPKMSTHFKWSNLEPGPGNRTSGSVCGQDPRYCVKPSSTGSNEWPNDISKWPICTEMANITSGLNLPHLSCEIVGRPCCYGIQGECVITAREECDFRQGYFHTEATLCSQVHCMNDICGMFNFINPEIPDQFYRLITSNFIHSGLLHIAITVIIQMILMRDIEKMIGWWRTAIIYILSGLAGTLMSAIFLPHYVDAGPSGAHFGILAALFVEIIRWSSDDNRMRTVLVLLAIFVFLLAIGLLPVVDNYAHCGGFVIGFLLALALRPLPRDENNKRIYKVSYIISGLVGLILCLCINGALVYIFYYYPLYSCDYCSYFNCIPLTSTFCDGMYVDIKR